VVTGIWEQTASTHVFNDDFNCFECSTLYELPLRDVGPDAYYADDFDFL
jgi:hypothetical protein